MCPPDLAGSSLTKTFFFSWQDFGFPWVTLLNLCPICALCPKPSPVPDALVWMSVSAALSPSIEEAPGSRYTVPWVAMMWDVNISDLSCPSEVGACGCQRHEDSGSLAAGR